jgi:N-methylhydantoinase B
LRFEPALERAAAEYRKALPADWRGGCYAALLDEGCRVAAVSQAARIVEIASAGAALCSFFEGDWRDGDVAVTNDPYHGSGHLLQFTAISPIGMANGGPAKGFAAINVDLSDMGGWEIGGDDPRSLDIWAEGARIVPVKAALGGRMRKELVELLALNSRTPKLVQRAIAALSQATIELAREAGALDAALGETAIRARESAAPIVQDLLGRLRRGAFQGAGTMPVPGFPDQQVRIGVELSARDGALHVKVSRAPEKSVRPINATPAMTQSAALLAVAAVLRLEPSASIGLQDALHVSAPSDSAVAVTDWLPVGYARRVTCRAVFSAVVEALGNAGFDKIDADQWWRRHSGLDDADLDMASGKASASRRKYLQSMEAAAGEAA